ncbi:single-stranded DNA-binding protein [Microbacterium ulmi]|uniref:Single-stranded DNA-binding protein n=1 Tax=Microbacterium ulmi TaxID=179095 RepID=A0A7Y2LX83_9MICO|nr:single-stranded DNA-binding protein [Microbacterium ulmi]NII71175.1 single-strand DNA-binding protein [Microbacterium ulmi]NNH02482.1 single-stranded DNA-binding protein [Microbacterium ulmi]
MSDTITVTGNIATDPEHKRTSAGIPITTFRVASGQRRFDQATGRWTETGTNWYTVSTYRGLAQHAFHSLRKGDRVLLTGRLRVRQWESNGKNGTAVEIDAEAIGHDLLWGRSTFEKDAPSTASTPAQAPAESWAGGPTAPAEADAWAAAPARDGEWSVPGADDGRAGVERERAAELVGADSPF